MEKRSSVTTRLISSRSDAASSWVSALVGDRLDLVDDVAQSDDLLRDPVVHLPGDPVALLRGGHQANVVEEDRGVQAQHELVGDRLRAVAQVTSFQAGVADQDDGSERVLAAVEPHGRLSSARLGESIGDADESPYDESRSGSDATSVDEHS